jgi:hypothetical protein
MTNAMPTHWPQRASAWFLLGATFVLGVSAGIVLASTWDVQRQAREIEQRLSQVPIRPTLHERLDAIEKRLQDIEDRLAR